MLLLGAQIIRFYHFVTGNRKSYTKYRISHALALEAFEILLRITKKNPRRVQMGCAVPKSNAHRYRVGVEPT